MARGSHTPTPGQARAPRATAARGAGRGAGLASSFATSSGSPCKNVSLGSSVSPEPQVLRCSLSSVRPSGAQLASCRPNVATQGWGTEFPGGLQQTSRRLLAEMPGRKARKNAQPSPPRAPAGRDQMGSAAILAGVGAGAAVEISVWVGSVSLLWASRSGGVCVLARVVRAPTGSSSGVLPRTVETAREGARSGIGMQLRFSGCKKSLLRAPRVPTCPASGPPGEKVQVRASATRKSHYPSRWGREKLREPPGRPALPTAGPHPPESWGVVGRRGPCSEHYHSLHSQQEQKQ